MGNKQCNCLSSSSGDIKRSKKRRDLSLTNSHHKDGYNSIGTDPNATNVSALQHIRDREQIDGKFI